MRLEHENLATVKRQILSVIGKHVNLNDYRVFFFGSRVNGKSDEWSDIDVGIEGGKPLPAGVLSDIQDEIADLPVLYKIDAVDFADANSDFKVLAKRRIEQIN